MAAEALIRLYRSGNLDEKHNRLILAHRRKITEKHTDEMVVSSHSETTSRRFGDCGGDSDHTDKPVWGHEDRGIDIDFPI
jgi:hypothetical protein